MDVGSALFFRMKIPKMLWSSAQTALFRNIMLSCCAHLKGKLLRPSLRLLVLTDTKGRELCLVLLIQQISTHTGTLKTRCGHCRGLRSLLFIKDLGISHVCGQVQEEELVEVNPAQVKSWIYGVVLSGDERTSMENRARPLVKTLYQDSTTLREGGVATSHICM
jgi:hypothetical protein